MFMSPFPTAQGANFQEFYGPNTQQRWNKPRGASLVMFMLLGPGANGANGSTGAGGVGGGSGALTRWIGPASLLPDSLIVIPGQAGVSDTTVDALYTATARVNFLLASRAVGQTAGAGAQPNIVSAQGILSSVGGQNGSAVGSFISASTTTPLSGGAAGAQTVGGIGADIAAQLGYPALAGGAVNNPGRNGFFIRPGSNQPLLSYGGTGSGGGGTGGNAGGKGGFGAGGGGGGITSSGSNLGGAGGEGAVFIWTLS